MHIHIFVATIYLLSCVQLFVTATHQASLSFTVSHSLLKLMSIESVMLSNHLRGTLKSLPQYYKLKTSILQYSATFIHHDYWKNHSFDSMECMYIYTYTFLFLFSTCFFFDYRHSTRYFLFFVFQLHLFRKLLAFIIIE